jgi:hypothetical protein
MEGMAMTNIEKYEECRKYWEDKDRQAKEKREKEYGDYLNKEVQKAWHIYCQEKGLAMS